MVNPWLPEPLLVGDDVAEAAETADSLSTAFLVVLESLSPDERAAFLLREVFGYPYGELADMLGRFEAACRQLVHRARTQVSARRPRFPADPARQRAVTEQFVHACPRATSVSSSPCPPRDRLYSGMTNSRLVLDSMVSSLTMNGA